MKKQTNVGKVIDNYEKETNEMQKKSITTLIIIILVILLLLGFLSVIVFIRNKGNEKTPIPTVSMSDDDIYKFIKESIKYNKRDNCSNDGSISVWFYKEEPSLENRPIIDWTDDKTLEDHLYDIYYDADSLKMYLFKKNEETSEYFWEILEDEDLSISLDIAYNMKDTNDGERKIFTCIPVPPYEPGDVYVNKEDVYVIVEEKIEEDDSSENDWVSLIDYIKTTTTVKTSKRISKKISTSETTASTTTTTTTTTLLTTAAIPITTTTVADNSGGSSAVIESDKKLNIEFRNLQVIEGSVTNSNPSVNNQSITFDINLNKPGDFYAFSVDIVNTSNMNAQIDNITSSVLTLEQSKYLDLKLTYFDGSAINKKDTLNSNQTKKLKFVALYKDVEKLSGSDLNVSFNSKISFVQAD